VNASRGAARLRTGWAIAGVAALALAAPPLATAATVTAAGGVVALGDPDGAADVLSADLQFEDQTPSVDPPGWSVSLLGAPPPAPGAGCEPGFVGTLCALGADPPSALRVDLGAGDDQLQLTVEPEAAAAPTAIAVAGGPGDDLIATVLARAELDGGDGDDTLVPDDRVALDFPPAPTPGGVIRGGAGTDTVSYEPALDPVAVSLDGRANDGRAGDADDVRGDVEDIRGGGFGDTLGGNAGANRIAGLAGDDRIDGRGGRDTLEGGGGDDVVGALDGAPGDRADCSDGTDTALLDAGDTPVACERTTWAPGLGSTRLRLRDGRIPVRLACPRASAGRCRGTVRIVGARSVASGTYRARPGARVTVRLHPTRSGRKALRRRGALAAQVVVQPARTTGAAGRSVTVR